MSISGISTGWQNSLAGAATAKTNHTEKAAPEQMENVPALTEAEEMAQFKAQFYKDLSKVVVHESVGNTAINISEDAFKAMKADPEYREQVLSLAQRDWGSSYRPTGKCSVLITVGATEEAYRAHSWSEGYDGEFRTRSQNSFYKNSNKKSERKAASADSAEWWAQIKARQERQLNARMECRSFEERLQTRMQTQAEFRAKNAAAYDANMIPAAAKRPAEDFSG